MFKRIVVGTDGSDTASQAVEKATELAKLTGAELNIVSAFEPVSKSRLAAEQRDAPEDVQYEISPDRGRQPDPRSGRRPGSQGGGRGA